MQSMCPAPGLEFRDGIGGWKDLTDSVIWVSMI